MTLVKRTAGDPHRTEIEVADEFPDNNLNLDSTERLMTCGGKSKMKILVASSISPRKRGQS